MGARRMAQTTAGLRTSASSRKGERVRALWLLRGALLYRRGRWGEATRQFNPDVKDCRIVFPEGSERGRLEVWRLRVRRPAGRTPGFLQRVGKLQGGDRILTRVLVRETAGLRERGERQFAPLQSERRDWLPEETARTLKVSKLEKLAKVQPIATKNQEGQIGLRAPQEALRGWGKRSAAPVGQLVERCGHLLRHLQVSRFPENATVGEVREGSNKGKKGGQGRRDR